MGNLCATEARQHAPRKRPKSSRRTKSGPRSNNDNNKKKNRRVVTPQPDASSQSQAPLSPVADGSSKSIPRGGPPTSRPMQLHLADDAMRNPLDIAPPAVRAQVEVTSRGHGDDSMPPVLSSSPTPEVGDSGLDRQSFMQDEDDQRRFSACPSLLSDDWSRKVSHDQADDAARRFSTLTDEARSHSISSSNTSSSEAVPIRITVVASRPRAAVASGGDTGVEGDPIQQPRPHCLDEGGKKRALEEKLLRRKARALVLWLSRLPPPPFDDIPLTSYGDDDAQATAEEQPPWNDDVERKFSKIE